MPEDKTPPLRFWIGLHKDGTGRQCIVDFNGGPMEGVKQAWNDKNGDAVTVMETVVQPKLSRTAERYLELLKSNERFLGDPRLPLLEALLTEIGMECYVAGMQNAGLHPKRP